MDIKKYKVEENSDFRLTGSHVTYLTNETSLCEDEAKALKKLEKNTKKIAKLQEKLYADGKEGVIFVVQAMDAAGKDGTIRTVFGPLSTHGLKEVAFKGPSAEELGHDFLWRVAKNAPMKGEIAVFNRSHYEDVLVGSVRELYKGQAHAERIKADYSVIEDRLKDIKNYEKYLYRNSIRVVKLFLNVSKEEQTNRFISRAMEQKKNWKFNPGDIADQGLWDKYMEAYEVAINATSTEECPWYVVPADNKWYTRLVVSEIVLKTLEDMDPHFPESSEDELAYMKEYLASFGLPAEQ